MATDTTKSWFAVIYRNPTGKPGAHVFAAKNIVEAEGLVHQKICPGGEGLISLAEVTPPNPDTLHEAWRTLLRHSMGFEALMPDLSYGDAFARFYLLGYERALPLPTVDPRTAWRAFLACERNGYDGQSLYVITQDLDDDPDNVNAGKMILNASGVQMEKPLVYDGVLDEAYIEAIKTLAAAAGVDDEGNLPE